MQVKTIEFKLLERAKNVSIEIASFPKLELIHVADVVAREKGIEREEVI